MKECEVFGVLALVCGLAVGIRAQQPKEIEEAKQKKLGTNRYTLIGTLDFLTKEELMKDEVRRQFTRPEVANATGQLQNGKKLAVRGLLITAPNEKRLNLVSVQQLSDTCK